MSKPLNSEKLDLLFAVLANEHRREIVCALSTQPHSVSQLAAMRGLSLPAIHKHIKTLENADLVTRKKIGRVNFLAINRETLTLPKDWLGQFSTHWGSDKETLENYEKYLKGGDDK